MLKFLFLVLILAHCLTVCPSKLVESPSCDDPCPEGSVCKLPALLFKGDYMYCPYDVAKPSCLNPDRKCSLEESKKHCGGYKHCEVYKYILCLEDSVEDYHLSEQQESLYCFNSHNCSYFYDFVPSGQVCEILFDETAPGAFVQKTKLEKRKGQPCNEKNHCGDHLGCWLDTEWYADGLLQELAERCYFRDDPCPALECPIGTVCAIESVYVEDKEKREKICQPYGSSCDYLWPSREVAKCADPAEVQQKPYRGHWSYGRR